MPISLPPVLALRRRCQALAALDLILSPDWEYRYYSFNCRWSPGQQMGSMRNGSGDEWMCLFHADGWAALKGLDHESEAWRKGGPDLSQALQRSVPPGFKEFSTEPAFRWEATTFAWYTEGEAGPWIRLGDATKFADLESGEESGLQVLTSGPEVYLRHASDYFEVEIDPRHVAHFFDHRPVTHSLVSAINREANLTDIASELFDEIGYPRGS